MTATVQTEFAHVDSEHRHFEPAEINDHPPVGVQVLSIIGFGVFSIVAVALAFDENWIAGLIVSAIITATWASTRTFGGKGIGKRKHRKTKVASVTPSVSPMKPSGNSSFDAYRSDVISRLEEESKEFDAFLERLRAARDSSEFDQFMSDRAQTSKSSAENV